jgi:hypothetical protein
VRRLGRPVQADPDGGLAGGGDQVQPLRVMRRAGLEQQGPPVAAAQAGDPHLVAGPPVVGGGELLQDPRLGSHRVGLLAGGPHVQAQLMAGLGLRVRQQVHLAAGLCAQRDHLPQPDHPARHRARPRLGGRRPGRPEPHAGRPPLQPRGPAGRFPELLPDEHGQVEVGHDPVGHLLIERTHGDQQLRGPPDPARPSGTAQLFLGQKPQVSLRPFAVHLHSVSPAQPADHRACRTPRPATRRIRRWSVFDDQLAVCGEAAEQDGLGASVPGPTGSSPEVIDFTNFANRPTASSGMRFGRRPR